MNETQNSDSVLSALRAADRWWFHDAHGLHDDAHHSAHRPLDLCVPLLTLTNEIRQIRDGSGREVTDPCDICDGKLPAAASSLPLMCRLIGHSRPLDYEHSDDGCPDPMYRYGDHSDYCPHGVRSVCRRCGR